MLTRSLDPESLMQMLEQGSDKKKPIILIVQGLLADKEALAFCESDCPQMCPIIMLSLVWTLASGPFTFSKLYPPLEFSQVIAPHLLPQLVCHELIPGGKTIPVTNENK